MMIDEWWISKELEVDGRGVSLEEFQLGADIPTNTRTRTFRTRVYSVTATLPCSLCTSVRLLQEDFPYFDVCMYLCMYVQEWAKNWP
jgi:hypothetical protein